MKRNRERRQHPRHQSDYPICIMHYSFGVISGFVSDMSEEGIYVVLENTGCFTPTMMVDAKCTGKGWDRLMPALGMEVVRVEKRGIALKYTELLYGKLKQAI